MFSNHHGNDTVIYKVLDITYSLSDFKICQIANDMKKVIIQLSIKTKTGLTMTIYAIILVHKSSRKMKSFS